MADVGPWTSGPGEILRHALKLLKKDSDTNRRLAMILIDNAVELMLKTYLGLPSRVTGIKIGRDKLREIGESFPKVLDAIEQHADDKLVGINLGEVEWYHRLRNELYHQGNGLTVERQKVDVYAELAKLLFKNLFGTEIKSEEDEYMELLGAFLGGWQRVARAMSRPVGSPKLHAHHAMLTAEAVRADGGDAQLVSDFIELQQIRNQVVHGEVKRNTVTRELVKRLDHLAVRLESLRPCD